MASNVEREPWDHSELRSRAPRVISPTPVSEGTAHRAHAELMRRDRMRPAPLRVLGRHPIVVPVLGIAMGFAIGLVLSRKH